MILEVGQVELRLAMPGRYDILKKCEFIGREGELSFSTHGADERNF